MWVCGAFQTEYEGASLKDMLMKQLDERGLILLGTGHDGFCDQYPGAVVSVKSRTWDDKYYQTWSWGWYKVGWRSSGLWAFQSITHVTARLALLWALEPGGLACPCVR